MSNAVLSIQKLEAGYGSKAVVRDFSLDVAAGEFVSLLGPSGSGKSSVLRAIAGFLPAMGGRILLEGRDITGETPERRNVGIVFQNYALFPTMTAFENIAFALRVAKRPQAEVEKRVRDMATLSGIDEQLTRNPAEMSGGQQQRVAIARALVTGSRVLLFDEPLSNLDAKVRVTMRREIKRMQREVGFTAIFVTHDQEDALTMSDRIVVLNGGRAEQIGHGRTLYRQPATPFICQFIGASNELSPPVARRLLGAKGEGRSFVRLEDVLIAENGGGGARATVSHIEFLGSHSRVYMIVEGDTISAMLLGDDLPDVGSEVWVSIRPGAVHVFGGTCL
ncbi:ABC transporter ATP-binding protein (plasmid) [Sinorhizobium meliloti]|uniref:ABC transporter ATP-binding protein n=2 Tax=Sinorhizobium TaxID=28105 RepID=A0ABY8TFV9_9HYPH|nr:MULTISPECIES: ABC transporter ATP-binding protein [Sinorhizobium]ASP54336.1 ABC transporter ATP-binding protein [Sinorhizobium meliloti]RMI14985.1 ABC transporter ATP-binding protein [Sinorhizobium meliloti]RVH08732.1 ABC transporter ATP-binding protein [Sinorhizobium meliloti]RVK91638.1 ABC transporter ATP-binding protein [Sinorhizobium meliloti]RVL12961.1 ABC transporter ATP-binding protein [Sinorhizobium meliloti]